MMDTERDVHRWQEVEVRKMQQVRTSKFKGYKGNASKNSMETGDFSREERLTTLAAT